MVPQMRLTSPGISADASITKTSTRPPLCPLSAVTISPVGARRVAVEFTGPRCALEVVPRDLRLPLCDRLHDLVVVRVGCLGLDPAQRLLAAEAHLLHVLKGPARPLEV